jgi:cyclophilin family peptidyl-prolyl cis-trans isomerase
MRAILFLLVGCAATPVERAFERGQLGVAWDPIEESRRAAIEKELLSELGHERDPEVRDRLVEALGKIGADAETFRQLLAGAERERAAIAIGIAWKLERLKTPIDVTPLFGDADEKVRYAAAYAQLRMHRSCDAQLKDSSWLVRATCARASKDVAALATLIDDPDERVAAEAGRSLAKQKAVDALAASGAWRPQVAAAIAVESLDDPRWVPLFAARFDGDCLLALAHDRAAGRIELIERCDGDQRRKKVLAARALGEMRSNRLVELQALARDADGAVRSAAAEALGKRTGSDAILIELVNDPEPSVVSVAADAVAEKRIAGAPIAERLAGLSGPDAIEAIQSLAGAAAALKVRAAIPALVRLAGDENAAIRLAAKNALAELGEAAPHKDQRSARRAPRPDALVRLQTARGPILIRLFGRDAPGTVENFLRLVKRRFYDGLTFHRVVPDFVAQGGDPRGDGSGGPGWNIRCEVNPRRYREGSVGMALSGPDTGGSQFFIALSPQPHLDGRYTLFGEVAEGMATVRALREGDAIVFARVLE